MEVFSSSQVHDASTAAQLFDVYVQYKKDTRAITSWLLDNNSNRDACPENLSVRDLVAIAEGICAKAVAMPDIIGFHFRQAIKARNHLSKIFRRVSKDSSKSTSTENHEFFTSRSITYLLYSRST